jgi:hypothetical protein
MAIDLARVTRVRQRWPACRRRVLCVLSRRCAALYTFYWAGVMTASQVMLVGHVLMVLFMLIAMLLRRDRHTGASSGCRPPVRSERRTGPRSSGIMLGHQHDPARS